jgi:hypothetical protein
MELILGIIGFPAAGMFLEASGRWELNMNWVALYSLIMWVAMLMRGKVTWTKPPLDGGTK